MKDDPFHVSESNGGTVPDEYVNTCNMVVLVL